MANNAKAIKKHMTPREVMPNPVTATIDGKTYIGGIVFGPRAEWVAMIHEGDRQPVFFWGADRADAMRQGAEEVARREALGRAATAVLHPTDA